MKRFVLFTLLVIGLCGCENKSNTVTTQQPSNGTNADNTAVNVRDKNNTEKTPLDQNENKTDIDITAKIRKAVVATNMSTNAHNVKIITQNGEVTLRGPVKSADEKQKIEDIAHSVAGNSKVV